ncbi:MAG: hypothetical protein ACPLXM_07305, partial [Bacteroidales bacterium]
DEHLWFFLSENCYIPYEQFEERKKLRDAKQTWLYRLTAPLPKDHALHNPTPATTGKARDEHLWFFLSENCYIPYEQSKVFFII